MCFTGGYALAMMVDDSVAAPVVAQPATPFPIGKRRGADLGLSPDDQEAVVARAEAGCQVLGLRYADDKATGTRFETLQRLLGDNFVGVDFPGKGHAPSPSTAARRPSTACWPSSASGCAREPRFVCGSPRLFLRGHADDPVLAHARAAKGFMPDDEGLALHRLARERLPHGPVLEVGTYCGKSAVYLGAAAREVGGTVFTVDHHRGSEENQAGWEHHDPTLVDAESGRMDTLPTFRRTIERAGLEGHVVAVVGPSLDGQRALAHAAVAAVRRRRARRAAGHGRLRGLGAVGDAAAGCWPSTTCSPTRPTAAARRTTSTCGRWRAAPSRSARRSARCGCYAVRRGAGRRDAGRLTAQPHSRADRLEAAHQRACRA